MILPTTISILILLSIIGIYLWIKSRRKPKIDLTYAPKAIQELAEDAEKFHYIKYRYGIIKLSDEEYKLFLSGNRRNRNKMLKMAFQGKDLTKHFKPL